MEVVPAELKPAEKQGAALRVVARFSDGTTEDVTPLTTFASNNESVAFLVEQAGYFRKHARPAAPPPAAQRPARRNAIARPSDVDPPSVELKDPEFESPALLCQTLLSSNEFLYVD